MRNPKYEGEWLDLPRAEMATSMSFLPGADIAPRVTLAIGIKTITHNRDGLKLHPHKTVAIEISEGDQVASFDFPPTLARIYARRLLEFADAIEAGHAVSTEEVRTIPA